MSLRLGIYGAGQLGAYLCQAARTLGMTTSVVAPTDDSPANEHADHVIVAPLDDLAASKTLIDSVDLITFELEDIASPVLDLLAEAVGQGNVQVFPEVEHLRLLQNKCSQKRWFVEHSLPTAQFLDCPADTDIAALAEQFGLPFVQKTHRGGYDGRGVQVIRDADGGDELWPTATIIEEFIEPRRELAVLVARSPAGEEAVYPVVEMDFNQQGHILSHVLSPASLPVDISTQAQDIALQFIRHLDGTGLFAVEMFLRNDKELLINEVAPRVHNSGHLTIEAHQTSQYEQHLRAIAGLPLGGTEQKQPSAMVNILYADAIESACASGRGVIAVGNNTNVHWYGKKGSSLLRKMGHITSTADSVEEAQSNVDAALGALAS
ncbi:MAG: 5-(carboxyamino)imidazole ribonucleotide synthase [Pseudomonadaceae bacterium]|nr:5-(carboxyamino)imidazole ribonucleotide synthase [Pseudomonadaceae bacterium]